MKDNSGVELLMDLTTKSKVVKSLELNEIDFALVYVLPKKLQVNRVELMPNRLFYVSSSNLMVKSTTPRKKMFQDIPLIYRGHGSATRNAMETFITRNKFSVRKKNGTHP